MFSVSDSELVLEIQKGNRSAYTDLVRRYERPLFRLLVRFLKDEEAARDVLQEAFLKTYMNLRQFEFRCSFKNWLYKIALNTAKNKIRSQREMENVEDVILFEVCQIESDLVYEELIQKLREFVNLLPEKQRKTLELRVFEDLSFKEVSNLMNCPYDTAKANYRHALLKIREHFMQCHSA